MSKDKMTTASVLAFERSFDISDAIFAQQSNTDTNKLSPVVVTEKSVRGTISNRLKNAVANDPTKLDAEIQKPNLQTVDVASLDADKDTLIVTWSCKVLPFLGKPSVCNELEYQKELEKTTQGYIQTQGMTALAKRYAINILNGRWLWRNRMAAEQISLSITRKDDKKPMIEVNDVKQYQLNSFDYDDKSVNDLAKLIEAGLCGKEFVIFNVEAKLKMGLGQEVYPSQELILDTGKTKSKVLYEKNKQAAMHSQKISNAIRTIDTWYDDNVQFPIAIEPYGSVTSMGHAFRQPKQKLDFYTLFDNWVLKGEKPLLEQQHYVIAVLIRGGVFGASGKE
ncbi:MULTISPECIES: type I-F CRISPR-associated protein Csy3 [unclassified Gilliamella]|uniref:type I-F CRISPR-associated protein Csy3 n=1 Tax=unclassified Gilliamella TaxID=2685620 RepID=UPI001305B7B3|nr:MULTISPECIES: type I-F CRISPR-associated protein Csy3 [unclassified Gilliamella]MWP48994.1 type I-F CRISPR-associated protein Csy3 [Gilliamella sp. Lep-s35]MWP69081.1 type I-F CRISPR-associated protein Csy3 [Gilliamella sp. Lep-s5]MWP77256.1 type I-F CRISPR-associated protein Csy3 [Gilliamella sp. Lep-s21]